MRTNPEQRAPDELSIIDGFRVIKRYRWMIAILALLGTAVGYFYQAWTPARYVAEALIMLDGNNQGITGRADRVGRFDLNPEIVQTEVRVMGSRSFVREVVIDQELGNDPHLQPVEPVRWFEPIAKALALPVIRELGRNSLASNPAPQSAINMMLANLEVVQDGKTHVIAIRYQSHDANHAARIANALAKHYVLGRVRDRFEYSRRADNWIGEQLAALKGRYDASSSKLSAKERAFAKPSVDALMLDGNHMAAFNRELINARVTRQDKQERLARVRSLLSNGDIGGAFEDIGSSVILRNLHTLKAQLLRKEAELSSQLGPRHPTIVDMRQERNQLLARIEHEQNALVLRFANDVALAKRREQTLAQELEAMKGQGEAISRASLELDTLRQQVALDKRVYEEFISQFKPIENGDEVRKPDARIISEAAPPTIPVWPNSNLILMVSAVVSVGLGLMLTYVRELLESGFRHPDDVWRETGFNPLAAVLNYRSRGKKPEDAPINASGSAYCESIRALLNGLMPQKPARERGAVVILASALPKEGKSTTALALGRAAATDGLKVLLIDGDVRRPSVHKLAGVPLGPGIDMLLKGDLQPSDVIVRDPSSSLDIIPGALNSGMQPLRLSRRAPFERLFERLRLRYDLILVDSSPLVAVVDAKVMVRHADQVLLLVRWRRTARALVNQCIDGILSSGGKVGGIALTQVDISKMLAYQPADQFYSRKLVEGYYTG